METTPSARVRKGRFRKVKCISLSGCGSFWRRRGLVWLLMPRPRDPWMKLSHISRRGTWTCWNVSSFHQRAARWAVHKWIRNMRLMFVFVHTGAWQTPSAFGRQDLGAAKAWSSGVLVHVLLGRPGLLPSSCSNLSPGLWLFWCVFLFWSPNDGIAGGGSTSQWPHVGEKWLAHSFLERSQSTSSLRCREG